MPTPEEIFDSIGDSKIFSILDLRQGFNQIMIAEADRKKTAFHGSRQLWEWNVMPFGLKNAPVMFQRVMDFDYHIGDLEALFLRLRSVNLRCHPSKCDLESETVVYLGHRIIPNGLMPHEAKVQAIMRIPVPTDVPHLRGFLGLSNYYCTFIYEFSRVAHPLYQLLKKEAP